MGRHRSGSRSGGSRSRSSSRSRSGSRRSGSSGSSSSGIRTSSTPFTGCYNRSYYDRHGKIHHYYTNSRSFGTQSGWSTGIKVLLFCVTIHMLMMLLPFIIICLFQFGGKVSGDSSRIYIDDNANVLTTAEEEKVLELLREVYDKSGMPVTIYTDNFSWKNYYDSIEVYAEEIYYGIGYEEDAMLILFTTDNSDVFYDWEYDMYCGDETVSCLSDATYDKLADNFQKGMAGQSLAEALDYSWNSVMDEMAKTQFGWAGLPVLVIMIAIYGTIYGFIIASVRKRNDAYRYFKENPELLSDMPMIMYGECPNCGASNTQQNETCPYCGSLLKISGGDEKYVL